jgi:hypothetical protein
MVSSFVCADTAALSTQERIVAAVFPAAAAGLIGVDLCSASTSALVVWKQGDEMAENGVNTRGVGREG